MLEDTIRFIEENRLIAIVRGIAPKKCLKVADALYEGGFRLVEVTFNQKEPDSFRTTADAIAAIAEKYNGRSRHGSIAGVGGAGCCRRSAVYHLS